MIVVQFALRIRSRLWKVGQMNLNLLATSKKFITLHLFDLKLTKYTGKLMATPSEFLYPILHDIERTVLDLKKEYPSLKDKDVEGAYGQLKDYFRKKSFNKPVEEPESFSTVKQDIMDEILNTLDSREEEKFDDYLLNDALYSNGGDRFININQVYVVCFNNLMKSVKLWRKNKNGPSYLTHISEYIPS